MLRLNSLVSEGTRRQRIENILILAYFCAMSIHDKPPVWLLLALGTSKKDIARTISL